MKKQFIFGLFICLFLVSIVSAEEINYTYNYDFEGIQLTQLKYEPYPVNPGEYFEVWIQANLGKESYAKFEFIEEYPFSIDGNENAIREYNNVGSTTVVMKYKIRVDKNAVEGISNLKIKYTNTRYSDSGVISNFPIQISNVQTDFDLIIQESSGTDVSIAIANIGKNTANSLIVRVPEQNNYRISGTNGQMVGNLDSGDYTIVSFSLAQTGRENDLQIQLDYTDSIGERRSVIKTVQFASASPTEFNMTGNGQVPSKTFQGGNFQAQQSSSIFKSVWFWIVILILAGGSYWYYKKHPEEIKQFVSKIKSKLNKKSGSEKSSKGTPEWVSAERTKRK